jgi:hypothetical protein
MKIGVDLFGMNLTCEVKCIRYHLSSSNAKKILDLCQTTSFRDLFHLSILSRLNQYTLLGIPPMPVSLIGNSITDNFAEIKYYSVAYFVNPAHCDLTRVSFPELRVLAQAIKTHLDEDTKREMDAIEMDLGSYENDDCEGIDF